MYYIGDVCCDPNYLSHHGIKGQKWGVRRFQNPDGSYTEIGKQRYDKYDMKKKDVVEKTLMRRANKEQAKAYKYMQKSERAYMHANDKKAERLKRKSDIQRENADYSEKDLAAYRSASDKDKKAMRRAARTSRFMWAGGGLIGGMIASSSSMKLQNLLGRNGGQSAEEALARGRQIIAKPKTSHILLADIGIGAGAIGIGVGSGISAAANAYKFSH